VKTKDEIERRLTKLRTRYAHKHVDLSQQRKHLNCVYNHAHKPNGNPKNLDTELEIAPRKQVTLLVIQDEQPIHLCMYGSDDPASWPGNICDDDAISRSCKMFQPKVSLDQARQEFIDKLSDDEYVFNNYRDMATLQWVLGKRVHEVPLTLWERFVFWFKSKLFKPQVPVAILPPADLPSDIWQDTNKVNNDSTQNSGS